MKKVVFTFTPKRYTLPYASDVHQQFLEFMPTDVQQQIQSDLAYCIEQGWLNTELEGKSPVTDANGKGIWVDLDKNTYTRVFECSNVDAFMSFFRQQSYYNLFINHYDSNINEATYNISIEE
jgi:hypothetical protein